MDLKYLVKRMGAMLVMVLMAVTAYAQGRTITGTVEDSSGEPLTGASVTVVGAQTGVITDIDGNFRLNNVLPTDKIQIAYIGYNTQVITVGNQSDFKVVLEENSQVLDDVVVIGYGTARKKDLTGAVVQINPDKVADRNPANVQDLLRGTPGLQIGYDASAKGGGSIQLRGQNSLYTDGGHNSPLIVLDGMQFYGELSEINPDDIAQIDVLKDASSAAIYGAKAASGVIIITTKKGKMGKPVINISANLGINTKSDYREVYGPKGYMKYREDWYKATTLGVREDGTYGYYSKGSGLPDGYYDHPSRVSDTNAWATSGSLTLSEGESLESLYARRLRLNEAQHVYNNYLAGKTVDWYDLTFRTGINQDYNASISGATEAVNYYFSLGYLSNEGAVRGNEYTALRASMKLNAKITKWLEIGAQANFQDRSDGDYQVSLGTNYWDANMLRNSPYAQLREEDGSFTQYPFNGNPTNGGYNYFFDRQYQSLDKGYTILNTIFNAKITLPYNITYQFNIAPRLQWFYDRWHVSADMPNSLPTDHKVNRNSSKSYDWNLNNTITWDYTFNEKHHVTLTAVQEAEENRYWSDNIAARDITPTDVLGFHYITGYDKDLSDMSVYDSHFTAAAYLGRAFYSYDNRYMVTATVRRDGYSAFGSNNPWATFWSAGLSWRFSQEKFVNLPWLDEGKLRLSYGTNGNRSLENPYVSLSNLANGGTMIYIDKSGKPVTVESLRVDRLGNPSLEWEKTKAWNVGLDFAVLNYRLSGSLEYYYKTTNDMIMNQRLPNFSGFSSITANLGEVMNQGFEITLNSVNFDMPNFRWETSVGFSYNRNEIKKLYGDKDENGREKDDTSNGWFIGKPVGEIWNYKVEGIWQIGEEAEAAKHGQRPGDPKVYNNPANDEYNEDGTLKKAVYNDDDKVFFGTWNPPIYWNMRNEFTFWKDFTFAFSMYSYMGHKSTSSDYLNQDNGGSWVTNTGNVFVKEYWTPENPSNFYGRLDALGPNGITGVSRVFKRDFVRLDNISLGYTLPQKWTRRAMIDKVRITASCNNVCTIDGNWKFGDPESGGLGVRTYNFGISLTL